MRFDEAQIELIVVRTAYLVRNRQRFAIVGLYGRKNLLASPLWIGYKKRGGKYVSKLL